MEEATRAASSDPVRSCALSLSGVVRLSRVCNVHALPERSSIERFALRQQTINYSSHWDRGQGFGILDVTAFLAAF